jgi:hypothetical protein
MMSDAIRWYDQNVFDVSRRYESVASETVHGWLVDLLPNAPALVPLHSGFDRLALRSK